ncbi:MAG: signal peptidase II [Pseudobdellovibrio sp.]
MTNTDSRKKIIILASILLLVVFLDQWTKTLAVKHLLGEPAILYFNGLFQLVYAENPGAFLGMGGDWSRPLRFIIFGLFVLIGLVVMLWSLVKNRISKADLYAYSFILAGGIGNVIDRLSHDNGHVIDFLFIDLGYPYLRTGVFNIADVAIVIGFFIVLPSVFKKQPA